MTTTIQVLHTARERKDDEFYTRYMDIEEEISHYPAECFEGKVIYCNCDRYDHSDFYEYFLDNFTKLKLKKLIASNYSEDPEQRFVAEVTADENNTPQAKITCLGEEGTGSFDSERSLQLLDEADIVVTNPPFSLYIPFFNMLIERGKDFIIVGPVHSLAYKDVLPTILDKRVKRGATKVGRFTFNPYSQDTKSANCLFFTTLNHSHQTPGVLKDNTNLYFGNEDKYPSFDEFPGINVDKTSNIPIDYYEPMGVPISYFNKHRDDEFEILGTSRYYGPPGDPRANGKYVFQRLIIQRIRDKR